MAGQIYNVLFLCTGNSARSIMGEAILNQMAGDRFHAFSAGSHPKGDVNPHTVTLLTGLGFDHSGFRSKSWDEFAVPGAPQLDFIFTVCDDAAGETCPIWPGHPMTAHWGIPDPAKATGTPAVAFARAYWMLEKRIKLLTALPIASLDPASLHAKLKAIGRTGEGATAKARGQS